MYRSRTLGCGLAIAMIVVVISVLVSACTEPRSDACREVCRREAECVEEIGSKIPFEEKECVAACAALEQDKAHNAARVQRHVDCVRKQKTCAAVMECK